MISHNYVPSVSCDFRRANQTKRGTSKVVFCKQMWSSKFGGTKYGEGRELIRGSLLATGNPQVEENFSKGNSKLGVEGKGHMSTEPGRRPPSLLHLSINTAALHINRLSNLVSIRIPDSIIEELFEVRGHCQYGELLISVLS